MSQQTRIDQFYKASISKRVSKSTVNDPKKATVQKNVVRLTNKRKKASAKNLANCSVVHESIDSINLGNQLQMQCEDRLEPIKTSPERNLPKLDTTVVSRLKRSTSPPNDVSVRVSNLNYPEVGKDLKPLFEELASRGICISNIETEELSTMLELLQVDEMRRICQRLKVVSTGKKEELVQKLQKYSNTRIMTLLIPNLDPQKSLSDTFFMLSTVQQGKMIFPKIPAARFPIFSSKKHLSNYITAKNAFTDTLNAIEKKQWHTVRNFGSMAKMQLANYNLSSKNPMLPSHVKHFMPEYIWLKLLSKAIDAFKKTTETLSEAVNILNLLLKQKSYMQHRKGTWYAELALIEMFHRKDIGASARITIQALKEPNLTEVDRVDLLERAKKIAKRKTKINEDVRLYIQEELNNQSCRMIPRSTIIFNTIKAMVMRGNVAGAKTKCFIDTGTEDQSYGTVEDVALYHYYKNGFPNGIHCEGALPISLFCALFWEEIYDIEVPGAFVTMYQDAPQDLYTESFYENRKEQIDMKLQILHNLDPETLSNMMENRFNIYSSFVSIMQPSIFKNASCFKEIVFCLGTEGVIGICKRLIDNFKLWKAGFPDLFLWNFNTHEHKIVEVKGPGDTLSTKQELWLDYLNRLGLNTEVCIVECKYFKCFQISIFHSL
ncbi:hypothetical protein KM043_011895 [Ampulex compressa]|nr:hypothetical protein KM043_011895 [Ampulex compressa]